MPSQSTLRSLAFRKSVSTSSKASRSTASSPLRAGSAIFGIDRHEQSRRFALSSGEQDRRQSLSSLDGRFISAAPRLEELHQLLARAVVVPFAVAPDDLEQPRGRLGALACRVQR